MRRQRMIIDDIQPGFNVTEIHSITVKASLDEVFTAMHEVTLQDMSAIVKFLLWLRSLPEKLAGRREMAADGAKPLLTSMVQNGFLLLGERKNSEIIFGMMAPASIGRVWKASSNRHVTFAGPREFLEFCEPDYIRVVANLLMVGPDKTGMVTVRTESRCHALSDHAYKEFRPYWCIIRPFSGLIRRLWLRGIKRRAERKV
jgi:hypothetical protein